MNKPESKQQVEKRYQDMGLDVESGRDEPGKIYEPHRHEQTLLFTLGGTLDIRINNGAWQTLQPGSEFTIGTNQLHEAVVGPEGWEYVAAWNPEEAKRYEH